MRSSTLATGSGSALRAREVASICSRASAGVISSIGRSFASPIALRTSWICGCRLGTAPSGPVVAELILSASARKASRPAAPDLRIGGAVATGIDGGLAAGWCNHVDIRVVGRVACDPGADFEDLGVTLRAVLQAMPVGVSGREPGGVAGAQHLLAAVGDEHDLARKHIDELVAPGMPVALARPGAGRQAEKVYAELRQPGGVAQFGARACAARNVEGRWVKGADDRGQLIDTDA